MLSFCVIEYPHSLKKSDTNDFELWSSVGVAYSVNDNFKVGLKEHLTTQRKCDDHRYLFYRFIPRIRAVYRFSNWPGRSQAYYQKMITKEKNKGLKITSDIISIFLINMILIGLLPLIEFVIKIKIN